MGAMKPRKRKCQACGDRFQPSTTMQVACGYDCAIDVARQRIEKRERKEWRERKARMKTRQQWLKEAQQAFNAWIRHRDRHQPCISCGRHHDGQYHAGHYRTTKAQPALRFHELNVHKQCSACNSHLSGNLVEYRINLLRKIGAEAMEWLEQDHGIKRHTTDELKVIKDDYRKRLREAKENADG